MEQTKSYQQLLSENHELQWQLEEANDTIEAIRTGQVDALVVKNEGNHQLYTLKSADHTYRVFIEKMSEGAVTINREGFILYCNSSFANMVKFPLEKVIGIPFETFITNDSRKRYDKLNKAGWEKDSKEELYIRNKYDQTTCCLCSFAALEMDGGAALSVILTDLTPQKENQKQLLIQNQKLESAQNLTVQQNDELEATVRERTKDLLISRSISNYFLTILPKLPGLTCPMVISTILMNAGMNIQALAMKKQKAGDGARLSILMI